MLNNPASLSRDSNRSKRSRRSRQKLRKDPDFQLLLIDNKTGDIMDPIPMKYDGGNGERILVIVKKYQEYSVKVVINPGAWNPETNCYNWYCVELLIDGTHIKQRFIEKPTNGGSTSYIFDSCPAGRPFIFDVRHDGTDGPRDHIEDKDDVGMITLQFYRAQSTSYHDHQEYKRKRRKYNNGSYHSTNSHMIREAEKKRMDMTTKEKKSTMRTVFGHATREFRSGASGRGPPAKIVDGDDNISCTTMYDSAEAFELRGWINPLKDEHFQKYFPNRNFEEEGRRYEEMGRRSRNINAVCDLTNPGGPVWT